MQIYELGNNGRMISGSGEAKDQTGKNAGRISRESFFDRLCQNMNTQTAEKAQKEPERAAAQTKRCEMVPAAKEVEVRRIPYSECDRVRINVLEGYTLKAKLEPEEPGNRTKAGSIYVEMKDEEGNIKAYLFDGKKLQKESGSAMERIAYEVMNSSLDKSFRSAAKTVPKGIL